jgi:TRAP-type C4-dicarboxylate transport system permease small subunit
MRLEVNTLENRAGNWLFNLCNILEKITLYITMGICSIMLIIAWVHVIRRYVFNDALTWSEEFLRFSLVWFALLSASIIHKRRGHLGIVIFRERMPKIIKNIFERLMPFLATIATSIATIYGINLVMMVKDQLTAALRIPMSLPYASIPVAFFLMTLYGISHIIEDFQGIQIKKGDSGSN